MVLGATVTVWVHCASSDEVGVPPRAWEPEWTGEETTAAVPESQVQPVSEPDSKPGLVSRLAAAAAAGPVDMYRAAGTSRAAAAAAKPRRGWRFCGRMGGRTPSYGWVGGVGAAGSAWRGGRCGGYGVARRRSRWSSPLRLV